MGERWFIHKASRDTTFPYAGPTCDAAKVPRGKWYDSRDDAERDAALLSAANPVGFVVERAAPERPPLEELQDWTGIDPSRIVAYALWLEEENRRLRHMLSIREAELGLIVREPR